MDELSGFIFLCNGKTKPECFMYRVFGLPKGKRDIVEKIRPGMNLFLFDVERKLLYGPYTATSVGKLNLEPAAFGGKFPAQVSFRICMDCFPLSESSFKHAIQDNYYAKGKFKQELNGQQVRSLLSLFRPLTMPASTPGSPLLPRTSMPFLARQNQCQPQETIRLQKDPYVAGMQLTHNPAILKQHALQEVESPQYAYYRSLVHAHGSNDLQALTAPTVSYSEYPYDSRMQCSHAPEVLETQHIKQSFLPSQPVSDGAMVGYVPQPMQSQTLPVPTASYHSTDVQQAYLQGNSYNSYWPGGETFPNNQHSGSAYGDYQLSSQRGQEIVQHQENALHNYSLYWPTTTYTVQHRQLGPQGTTSAQAVGNQPVPPYS